MQKEAKKDDSVDLAKELELSGVTSGFVDPATSETPAPVSSAKTDVPQVPGENVCIFPNNESATIHSRVKENQDDPGQLGRIPTGVFDVNYYATSSAGDNFADYGDYMKYRQAMNTLLNLQNYFDYTQDYFFVNNAFIPYQHWTAFADKFDAVCGEAQSVAGKDIMKKVGEKEAMMCALFNKVGILESINWLAEEGGPTGWHCPNTVETKVAEVLQDMTTEEAYKELNNLVEDIQNLHVGCNENEGT